MNLKFCAACLALSAMMATGAHAADADPSVKVHPPGVSELHLEKGDKVPDQYRRKELAATDWVKKGLKAPEEDSQWVVIDHQYVMVSTVNGTIIEIATQKP